MEAPEAKEHRQSVQAVKRKEIELWKECSPETYFRLLIPRNLNNKLYCLNLC